MIQSDPSSVDVSHPAPGQMRLKMLSHPATIAKVRQAFESFTEQAGFNDADRGQIILVVNEALANIMRHAYSGATDKPIEINATTDGDAVHIDLRDWGNGRLPDPGHKHDPLTPGGLGMVCLKQFMDRISYHPQPDGMLLTMIRHKKDHP